MKALLIALILIGSCTFKKNNQKLQGHEELYSEPETPKIKDLESHEKRIVIAATNDVHGSFSPKVFSFKDQHNEKKQSIQIGGPEVMASYFNILRETFQNVLLVDSGDIFSSAKALDQVVNFYNSNKYDAVTVGLRDFNLKVPAKMKNNSNLFQAFAKKSEVPMVLSNLYELKTARVVEWEGTQAHILKNVDGVKVGIIGLIPDDIVAQTPINNRVGLFVENMLQSTLRHSRILRSLGAEVIIVLTHQGIECGNAMATEAKIPLKKVNFDPALEKICDLKSPLGEYLERLPPDLVDVVIGGRHHQKMANIINGTIVLSGFPDGQSFNYAELVIDSKTGKLVPEKTVVHQPVMFCNEFFKETQDCYHEDSTVDHKKRSQATFLGKPVNPALAIEASTDRKVFEVKSLPQNLEVFQADLSYLPQSSGETQLIVLHFTGNELMKILEEDFNGDRRDHWLPSPFLVKEENLFLSLSGEDLNRTKSYRILTDLESLQKHEKLLAKVSALEFEALMNHSWASLEEDVVTTQLAAQSR